MSKKDEEIGMRIVIYVIIGVILAPFVLIYLILKIIAQITDIVNEKNKNMIRYDLKLTDNETEQLNIIDNMNGQEFEKFMTALLIKNGFENVGTTKISGDHGADIIGEYNDVKYAFQCKRFESKVGARPIGEIIRGMNYYECERGVVITNNYFTNQAYIEASVNNIELWDRNKIIDLYRNAYKALEQEENIKKKYSLNDKKQIQLIIIVVLMIFAGIMGIISAINSDISNKKDERESSSTEIKNENYSFIQIEESSNKTTTQQENQKSYLFYLEELNNWVNEDGFFITGQNDLKVRVSAEAMIELINEEFNLNLSHNNSRIQMNGKDITMTELRNIQVD